jgi:hypothetical protein
MECHVCGTEVRPEHKFCMECGARLRRPTGELALAPPSLADEETRGLPALPGSSSHPMFDPVTGQLLAVPPPPRLPPPDEDATNVLPAVGAPLGRGGFGPPDVSAQGPGRWDHPAEPAPLWPGESSSGYAIERIPATTLQPPYRGAEDTAYYDDTGRVPATYAPWEAAPWEQPETAAPPARVFRVKPLLVLTVLAAVAAVVGMAADLLDVGLAGNAALDGAWRLNDFGTNLTVAGILTALTMVLGALAWCVGYRWGAGLAGGGGAALAGWVALALGQAEVVVNEAQRVGGPTAVARGIGYWGLVAAGGLGLVVLFVSLVRTGDDGRAGLDPWVAALGAMATIAAVVGPLIPIDDADIDLNWSSPPGTDLPTAWFAARFAQLVLLLLCGVFGFLLVRRYGLGLAIGGTVCAGWLVLTAATEQTDFPVGPAVGNPGDLQRSPANGVAIVPTDGPHIVTIVGVGLMLFFGLVATAMALIDDR